MSCYGCPALSGSQGVVYNRRVSGDSYTWTHYEVAQGDRALGCGVTDTNMHRFSDLHTKLVGTDLYKITRAFYYHHPDGTISVPPGFIFDFDSVPRIPFAYAWLKGRARRSAAIHDWMYYAQYGRKRADRVFLQAMKDEGVPRRHRWPLYMAVRSGGWVSYRRHGSDPQGLLQDLR